MDWFDPEYPEHTREWVGIQGERDWLDLHDIGRVFKTKGFPPLFGAPHGKGDLPFLRRLRCILQNQKPRPDFILWMRDSDTDSTREKQRREFVGELPHAAQRSYLLAFPKQCGEAWVLSGWRAETREHKTAEKTIHDQLKGRRLPRDAHLINHRHTKPRGEWCLRQLGLNQHEAETEALLSAWTRRQDETGILAFHQLLDATTWLHSEFGLCPQG